MLFSAHRALERLPEPNRGRKREGRERIWTGSRANELTRAKVYKWVWSFRQIAQRWKMMMNNPIKKAKKVLKHLRKEGKNCQMSPGLAIFMSKEEYSGLHILQPGSKLIYYPSD